MSTLEEIKSVALDKSLSKSQKVETFVKKYGYKKSVAEREIDNIILVARFNERREREELRLALTYGVEIECYNVRRVDLINKLREYDIVCTDECYNHRDHTDGVYKCVSDASIQGSNANEIVTPVLKDLDSLKIVCKALGEVGAKVNKSCGLHVHIGAQNLTIDNIKNVCENYQVLETFIDSFMPASRRENFYCKSLRDIDLNGVDDKLSLIRAFRGDRYHKVNVTALDRHNTIEFRQHSGTTDFKKISNWIKFLSALVRYSRDNGLLPTTAEDSAKNTILNLLDEDTRRYFEGRINHFINE